MHDHAPSLLSHMRATPQSIPMAIRDAEGPGGYDCGALGASQKMLGGSTSSARAAFLAECWEGEYPVVKRCSEAPKRRIHRSCLGTCKWRGFITSHDRLSAGRDVLLQQPHDARHRGRRILTAACLCKSCGFKSAKLQGCLKYKNPNCFRSLQRTNPSCSCIRDNPAA